MNKRSFDSALIAIGIILLSMAAGFAWVYWALLMHYGAAWA